MKGNMQYYECSLNNIKRCSPKTVSGVYNSSGKTMIFTFESESKDITTGTITIGSVKNTVNFTLSKDRPTYPIKGQYLLYSQFGKKGNHLGEITCYACHGTGDCLQCNNKGYYYHTYTYANGTKRTLTVTCTACNGQKMCATCHGGDIKVIAPIPDN